jgi:hypothetical protein
MRRFLSWRRSIWKNGKIDKKRWAHGGGEAVIRPLHGRPGHSRPDPMETTGGDSDGWPWSLLRSRCPSRRGRGTWLVPTTRSPGPERRPGSSPLVAKTRPTHTPAFHRFL